MQGGGREGPGNEARGLQCRGEGGRALGMRLGAYSVGCSRCYIPHPIPDVHIHVLRLSNPVYQGRDVICLV